MSVQDIRELFGVELLGAHKQKEKMIQIPDQVMKELLAALGEAIETLGTACGDCNCEGDFSFSRGRLYSIKNVVEETAKEVII